MDRIPITMCHGIRPAGDKPLTFEHLRTLISIAAEMGFRSINYNDLWNWRQGTGSLPERPILFDFDHPVRSMRHEVHNILSQHDFRGNLFINTGPLDPASNDPYKKEPVMTWDEIGQLVDLGWHIGAHTVTHPNLSKLFAKDPSGQQLREELEQCDTTIEKYLGIKPKDFAYTGTSWSSAAEAQVVKRYRFGRLWIVRANYEADGKEVRYADLVGIEGPDDPDGGPPMPARYITRDTHPYRLPSMELQGLIYTPDAFRRYLEGADRTPLTNPCRLI